MIIKVNFSKQSVMNDVIGMKHMYMRLEDINADIK